MPRTMPRIDDEVKCPVCGFECVHPVAVRVEPVAQELGVGDEWLPRNDRQCELLDNARRLEHYAGLISTSAPKPPKSLAKASGKRFMQPAPVMASGGPPISAPDASQGGASRPQRIRRSRKNFS